MANYPFGYSATSSAAYGSTTRKYGFTNIKNHFQGSPSGQLIASPVPGTPDSLLTTAVYADGIIRCQIALGPINNSGYQNGGFIFRKQVSANSYYLLLFNGGGTDYILYRVDAGVRTALDIFEMDLTPINTFFNVEIHFEGGWITVMVDNQVVLSYYDITYTSGYLGFYAEGACIFQNFSMPALYTHASSFTINAGDSFNDALDNLCQVQGSYYKMNYNGSFQALLPQSTDTSVYTYQNEIMSNGYKQDDTEDLNLVIVYGVNNNINGNAFSQTSITAHGNKVRTTIITDETLLTNASCTAEAQRQLAIIQRYANQPQVETTVNVGLELFDVVTINDSVTGINTAYRVMNITTNYSANDTEYNQILGLASP